MFPGAVEVRGYRECDPEGAIIDLGRVGKNLTIKNGWLERENMGGVPP